MNTQRHDEIGRKPLELDRRQVYYRRRDARLEGQILTEKPGMELTAGAIGFAVFISAAIVIVAWALVAVWF
jgi:hypothetical protein